MVSSDFEVVIYQGSPERQPASRNTSPPETTGTLYVEAQAEADYDGSLVALTAKLTFIFAESVFTARLNEEMLGTDLYEECFFPHCLRSIKAVEYVGEGDKHGLIFVEKCKVVINSYKMLDQRKIQFPQELLSCIDPQLLPSVDFEGTWERLIFDEDLKENLVTFMANLLRFSFIGQNSSTTVNRLILLSGPPGTGKTSLSTSLAQKLSIRLNNTFDQTILLRLNAATLLSQYFGQSAVKIHSIFESLAVLSTSRPKTLNVLLIDEVESLAGSRATASARNEVHDAVRATNALLTGFDMVKNNPNVLIICTSNLNTTLDAAFVDRCSRQISVSPPSAAARYEILRHGITGLVQREVICADETPLPTFRDAECKLAEDYDTAGCTLRRLAEKLENTGENSSPVSARWLSQLAEIALANDLAPDARCTVIAAIHSMERYVDKTFELPAAPKLKGTNMKRKPGPEVDATSGSPKKLRLEIDVLPEGKFINGIVEVVEKRLEARMTNKLSEVQRQEIKLMIEEALGNWGIANGMNDDIQDKDIRSNLSTSAANFEQDIPMDLNC